MSDEYPGSGITKTTEETKERVERDETSQDSGKVADSTPQSSSSASKVDSAESGVLQSDPAEVKQVTAQHSTVGLESSAVAAPTPESKTGILKSIKKKCKEVLTKISPRKHDSVPFVAEGAASGVSASAPPSSSKAAKHLTKEQKGTLVLNSPISEGRTLMTEISMSSDDTDLPLDADRKTSIASCDTGAHISMLPNLDETSSVQDPEEKPTEDKGSNEDVADDSSVPMEDEQ